MTSREGAGRLRRMTRRNMLDRTRSKLLFPLLLCGLTSLAAGAEEEFFNPAHAPGYAQTPWATVHADSSNSDYVPIETSLDLVQSFHVLEGAALWTPPTLGLEGQIYIASGRGPGTSHLHAFSREGALLWESPPQESLDDLDSAALISAPVVDADGDVYIGDANQFWAFHGDGQQKWVTDFTQLNIEGPFITGMICGEYVGGISADGKVMLLRRADGKLALPVLDLPGGAGPDGPAIPDALWADGLVDPAIRDRAWEILRGHRYEIANSPAVHPQTGRIFIIGAGEAEEGRFYGIDVEPDRLRIDFATPVPPGSGTSPAISPDGARLYAMANGEMFAIDTESGKPLWTLAVNGQDASPSVARDDTVYALGGERLVAVDGKLGRLKWSADYSDFAASRLPEVWTRFGLLTTGKPVAFVDSVVTVTPNQLWTSLLIGYEVNLFGRRFTHAVETYLVALRPEDGAVQRFYPIPDTSEGAITLTRDGDLILDILAAQASIAYYAGYQWLLPAVARVEKPRAGLVGFRPDTGIVDSGAGVIFP